MGFKVIEPRADGECCIIIMVDEEQHNLQVEIDPVLLIELQFADGL